MSERFCPKCGRKLPADANFCLNCGARIIQLVGEKHRSVMVTAGGILVILASCVSAIEAFFAFMASVAFVLGLGYYGYAIGFSELTRFYAILFITGLFGLIGFALGLAAGIQSLRRKQFAFAISGIAFLMFAGFLDFLTILDPPAGGEWFGLLFAIPIVILSLLGLIFIAVRKREFD